MEGAEYATFKSPVPCLPLRHVGDFVKAWPGGFEILDMGQGFFHCCLGFYVVCPRGSNFSFTRESIPHTSFILCHIATKQPLNMAQEKL